ncbi:DNA adenine methylase [Leadbettera azotonutricia]|uniref:site-specific DNA-methyltransferase (adenine-specific) n=1 Tax=Leadbettera azotonutricia (strain ATCC BAA-888 / DSM 13862 / ZAS-9) TaxID=545695 RepID=F5Y7H0_LEAAZ|nr:DNA adenine methylase [Leadbettera azotonutricia]AEF80714.1 D12 class N6 adenine-specific DNA methyltransferase superfamily [Leadbettera azotonutricia ZAS-9]
MSEQSLLIDTELDKGLCENEDFLTQQLITYIGNKRSLLEFIGRGVRKAQSRLNKQKLSMFDVFSGSGIVARYFKQYSSLLIANDLEKYSTLINQCYLSNKDDINSVHLRQYYHELIDHLNHSQLNKGIISDLYAPIDEQNIQAGDRVFYTARNAKYIDTARQYIGSMPEVYQKYFLAPLLSEASIHANTSGVFKGFYKNKETGIGQFGGKNQDALFRITGDINLPFPLFSRYNSDVLVYNGDSNQIIEEAPEVDIAYLDPPYKQHPYGSNYFMLNLILDYKYPENTSKISGIPENWNRSSYNKGNYALFSLTDLVTNIKAKYVLISFNSDGFIPLDEMKNMLEKLGKVDVLETQYNTFRGSRNLNNRDIHVKEYLYVLEK